MASVLLSVMQTTTDPAGAAAAPRPIRLDACDGTDTQGRVDGHALSSPAQVYGVARFPAWPMERLTPIRRERPPAHTSSVDAISTRPGPMATACRDATTLGRAAHDARVTAWREAR